MVNKIKYDIKDERKICKLYISKQGLICKRYKEVKQLNSKNNTPLKHGQRT